MRADGVNTETMPQAFRGAVRAWGYARLGYDFLDPAIGGFSRIAPKGAPPPCFDLWDLRMPWTRSSVSRKSGGTGTERKTRSLRFFRERKTIVPSERSTRDAVSSRASEIRHPV